MKNLIKRLKCLLGFHNEQNIHFIEKDYAVTMCVRCGKVSARGQTVNEPWQVCCQEWVTNKPCNHKK